jgi:hypothetical protein
VGKGELTPEGMRQRYLLGKHSRQRYTVDYPFIPVDWQYDQAYLQSTDVQRTMQSGYSEVMGFFPPNDSGAPLMTDGMLTAINTISAPPMNVRNAETINSDLSNKGLPYAYISNPGYNFMNPTTLDDVSYSGCRYVAETTTALREDNPAYVTYAYLADDIRQPVADAL